MSNSPKERPVSPKEMPDMSTVYRCVEELCARNSGTLPKELVESIYEEWNKVMQNKNVTSKEVLDDMARGEEDAVLAQIALENNPIKEENPNPQPPNQQQQRKTHIPL